MSARSLNRVMLIGNLTRDPELRYTPQGTAVCTFGLATNRSWVPSDGGERQEETEYHRVVAWAKLAEICSQLLYKGRKVYVEGRLQTRKWTGQDGMERETTEVVIDSMIALGEPKGKSGYAEDDAAYEYEGYEQAKPGKAPAGTATAVAVTDTNTGTKPAAETAADDSVSQTVDDLMANDANLPSPKKTAKKASKTAAKEEVDADDIPF
jgi:single-strand DNA-binding protein